MGVSPGTTGNLGPWSHHPAWAHSATTNMATIPAMLTVPSVCHVSYSLCSPSASPTVPTTPAVPSTVSMHSLPSVLISTEPPTLNPVSPIPAASTLPAMLTPLTTPIGILSILIVPNLTRPARRTKAAALTALTVPIVHALWYTCTGNIPVVLQTEGMCLPGDWTAEIRGLTAERGSKETEGREGGREGVMEWDRKRETATEKARVEWQLGSGATCTWRRVREVTILLRCNWYCGWSKKKKITDILILATDLKCFAD